VLRKIIGRLSYANLMATLALFVALGGGAYAVSLEKNSVGSRQIIDGRVKSVDVHNDSLTAADIKDKDGYEPADFQSFDLPNANERGCETPGYANSWISDSSRAPVSYYRDPAGIVSLSGVIYKCGDGESSSPIFTLPRGYRVKQERPFGFVGASPWGYPGLPVLIIPEGDAYIGSLSSPQSPLNQGKSGDWLRLDSIRYRCDPRLKGARENGCPAYPPG